MGSGGGGQCGLPPVREEFLQAAGRMGADASEDVSEVGEGIDIETFTCSCETGQDGRRPATVVASEKHPVLAADSNTAQATFGTVVVNLQITIFAVADQSRPIREGI